MGFLAKGIKNYFGSGENACANTVDLSQDVERPIEVADVAAVAADEVRLSTVYQVGYLKHLKMQWDSYSSLAHHGVTAKVTPITEGERDERPNGSNSDERKEESLLPKGAISGDVFHEIMETLCNNDETKNNPGFKTIGEARLESIEADFADDIDSPFVRLVRRVMRKHAVSNQVKGGDSTERTIARMVWNALNTPIRVGGCEFLLKDIAPADRRAELEFVIDEATVLGAETPQLGGRVREGCFNGKIDLLVRPKGADGKVIVIDWKTNSLAAFDDGAVTAAMVDCGYDVQYKLYSLAVSRWLGAEKLGGVAYLFVRGGEKAGMMSGVFARSVDAEYMIDCHKTICEIVQSFDHPS
jgi:ATP-dependent exoDNAse (exonuclease V) beta subunit